MQKKKYSGDTKFKVVMRLIKGEANKIELAREIGCYPTLINRWTEQFLEQASRIFESGKENSEKDRKIEELERIIGKLTVQNEFLKKTFGSLDSR